MTVFDEINERGTFWWMIDELNWTPVADWTFLLFLILVAIIFVAGGVAFMFAMERGRDRDFEERAARLGYVKGQARASDSDKDAAP